MNMKNKICIPCNQYIQHKSFIDRVMMYINRNTSTKSVELCINHNLTDDKSKEE